MSGSVVILGVFVADTTYRADRAPRMGETILGNSFALGPGGKGSNQSVAAARAGGQVHFITRLGRDAFADMALKLWSDAGVTPHVTQPDGAYTGAAYIFVEESSGNNAIIICPGVAGTIAPADIDGCINLLREASVFVTQLEQPIDAALHGLQTARSLGATTILNPAPAAALPDSMLGLCDFVTPNETEAEAMTGIPVHSIDDASRAAKNLLSRGVGAAIITLGENGALYCDAQTSVHVPAVNAGPVVETTGAGDAFNGAFATALADGLNPVEAVRFGCAAAGLSVTRPGAANSMPMRKDILALLGQT